MSPSGTYKRPDVYLELALIALGKVPLYLAGRSLEDYLADDMCQSAVERQLKVAGDALGQIRKLGPDLFARMPDAAVIVGLRNALARDYASRDHRRVYDAATHKVAELIGTLSLLLRESPEEPRI